MSKPRKKTPTWKKAAGAFLYVLFCVLALGAGTAFSVLKANPIIAEAIMQRVRNESAEDIFERDSLTLLILGCDVDLARGGKKVLRENARSDMMLVTKLDFKNKRIGGVSIPRDLEVQLPGYRAQKINAYHSIGGKELAKQAAEQVLGVTVDRVIVLNYEAFQDMVNLVGGVDVYVPKDMKYTDRRGGLFIDLKKGRHHMDGYTAMGFVRFRHSDSDFMRMQRQRDFMLALKDSVMKNPGLVQPLSEKAIEVLGGEMSQSEMVALGNFIKSIPADTIKMSNLPVYDGSGTNLLIDSSKLQDTLRENFLVTSTGDSTGTGNP